MKILHVGKFFPPFAGGIENFVADLLDEQIKQGIDARALVHEHQPPWQHADVVAEHQAVQRVPCWGRLLYAPISPQFPLYLHRAIQQFQPDILHLHLPNTSAFWAMALPVARRLPWVVHWHSDVVASHLDGRLALAYPVYRPFEQALLKHSAAVIATSAAYLAASVALKPWRNKCHVVSLGLNSQHLAQTTDAALAWAAQQWRGKALRLLSVGRLTYYKGHAQLLAAMQQDEKSQLLIVGKGEKKVELNQQIEQLKLQHQVQLLGYCDEAQLVALLQTCDCFCLPSLERTEAFGVVLMEAMFHQKPVIASNINGSGVTWVVKQNETGLLVPPFEPLAWQRAIGQMRDQSLRLRMGQAGRKRFDAYCRIEQVAKSIQDLYAIILAKTF